jgi:hypothetical protein
MPELLFAKGNSRQYWQMLTKNLIRAFNVKGGLDKGGVRRLILSLSWFVRGLLSFEYHAMFIKNVIFEVRHGGTADVKALAIFRLCSRPFRGLFMSNGLYEEFRKTRALVLKVIFTGLLKWMLEDPPQSAAVLHALITAIDIWHREPNITMILADPVIEELSRRYRARDIPRQHQRRVV